jgi:hypothetical protein
MITLPTIRNYPQIFKKKEKSRNEIGKTTLYEFLMALVLMKVVLIGDTLNSRAKYYSKHINKNLFSGIRLARSGYVNEVSNRNGTSSLL